VDSDTVHANKYKLFSVSAIGTFMATFEGSILNVALPSIADALNTPIHLVAWVVLSYSLTLISLMLVFGAWTEVRGYAFAYKFGYSFFLLGSLTCVLSPNIYVLIAGRVIQATGTGMFAAVGPALVTTVFPAKERGKGLALTVMMVSAGFTLGPVVGGLLLSFATWHSIFLINIPIGLIGLYLTSRFYRGLAPANPDKKVHLPAAFFMAVTLVSAVYGLSQINDHAITDPRVWGFFIVAFIGLFIFIHYEKNPDTALIGTDIFTNRNFLLSIGAQQTNFIAAAGVMVLIPFYLEQVKGFEPQQVGLLLVILPIMMFIVAPISGPLSDRIGYRALTSLGMLVYALGLYMLSFLRVDTETSYIVETFIVLGAGTGLFSSPNSSAIMGSVKDEQRSVTSGIMATSRNIGMSFGVAFSTAFFSYLQSRNVDLGSAKQIFVVSYRPVIYVASAVALVGSVICLIRSNRVR